MGLKEKNSNHSLNSVRLFLVPSFDGSDETSLVQNVEVVQTKQG